MPLPLLAAGGAAIAPWITGLIGGTTATGGSIWGLHNKYKEEGGTKDLWGWVTSGMPSAFSENIAQPTEQAQNIVNQYGGLEGIQEFYSQTGKFPWDSDIQQVQDETYQNYLNYGGRMSYEEWQTSGSPAVPSDDEMLQSEVERAKALREVETALTPYQQWEMQMAEQDRARAEQTSQLERQLLEQQISESQAQQRAAFAGPEQWIQRWAYDQGGQPPAPSWLGQFTGIPQGQTITPQAAKVASGQTLGQMTPSQLSGMQGYVDWSAGKAQGAPASGKDWLAQAQAQLPKREATQAKGWSYGGI